MSEILSLEELQSRLIKEKLTPGKILHIYCRDLTPDPKNKFLVLVCNASDPCQFFIINSKVHPFKKKRGHLRKSQVVLPCSDYGFLNDDSYLDCSKFLPIKRSDIEYQIKNGPEIERGSISPETVKQIIETVENAGALTKKHIDIVVKSLKDLVSD